MNCCQPEHPATPLQAGVVKVFVLSWSEYVLGYTVPRFPSLDPNSAVTPVTLSNDPIAEEICPVTWAK